MIQVAADTPVVNAEAEAQFVLNDWAASGHAEFIARNAAVHRTYFGLRIHGVVRQARCGSNEAHRASFRGSTEQCALGTA